MYKNSKLLASTTILECSFYLLRYWSSYDTIALFFSLLTLKCGKIKESFTRCGKEEKTLTSGTAKMRDSDIQVDSWYMELTFSVGILTKNQIKKAKKNLGQEKFTWKQGGEVGPPLARGCAMLQVRFPRMPSPEMENWSELVLSIQRGSVLGTDSSISPTQLSTYQDSRVLEFTGYIYSSVTYLSFYYQDHHAPFQRKNF